VVVVAGTLVLAACGGGGSGGERLAAGERPGQETTTTTGAPAEIGEDGHVQLICAEGDSVQTAIVDYTPDAPTFATPEEALEAGRRMENAYLADRAAEEPRARGDTPKPSHLQYERLGPGKTVEPGEARPWEITFVGRDETGVPVAAIIVARRANGRWISERFLACSDRIAKGGEY
jgi:hypothetical protein